MFLFISIVIPKIKIMKPGTNAINWFEISVTDMPRAKKFYESIFDMQMQEMEMMNMPMAFFPPDGSNGTVGGALIKSDMHKPSVDGAKVYLNGNPDLQQVLDKIEGAGGKVTMPKTLIDEMSGYMAFFTDSEGNAVGLHSNK